VFYDISLNQTPGKPTSETIQALTDLANQGSGRGASTASVSLYNVYKTRSYTCEVTLFGNVMVQPMMYFILRHIPMFEGPYLIVDVSHDIRPGQFTTKIIGVRQPIPILNNPSKQEAILRIQSAYLDTIEKEIYTNLKNNKPITPNDIPSPTTEGTNNFIIDAFLEKKREQFGDCSETLYGGAKKFTQQDGILTITTVNELKDLINGATPNNDVKKLVFSLIWLESTDEASNEIKAFNNNFIGLPLNINTIDTFISNFKGKLLDQYVCVGIGDSSYAMACFDTLRSAVEVACSKFKTLVVGENTNLNEEKVTNLLIENWPVKSPTATPPPAGQTVPTGSQTIKSSNPSEYNRILNKVKKAFIQAKAVNLFDSPETPQPSSAPGTTPLPSPTPPPPTPTPVPASSSGFDPNQFEFSMQIVCGDCATPSGDLNDGYINVKKSNGRYVNIKMSISAPSTAGNDTSCGSTYKFLATNIWGLNVFKLVSNPNNFVAFNCSNVNPQVCEITYISDPQGNTSNPISATYTLTKEYAFYTCNGSGNLIVLNNGENLIKSATITIEL
jgi:hypothetical protein